MQSDAKLTDIEEFEDSQEGKYLIFQMGEEEYGIEILFVNEIIGIQKITTLPDMTNYIKGVINLRGKVIPVIDIRLRFGLDPREYDERTCIVVVNLDQVAVGLIVDSVKEVIDISENQIDPPPSIKKGSESRFVKGLGKVSDNVKIILDVDKLLFEKEIEALMESMPE